METKEATNGLKAIFTERIHLFLCSGYYETYYNDAVIVSKILGIPLSRRYRWKDRDKGLESFPLVKIPIEALDIYLPHLIMAGKKVTICNQFDSP